MHIFWQQEANIDFLTDLYKILYDHSFGYDFVTNVQPNLDITIDSAEDYAIGLRYLKYIEWVYMDPCADNDSERPEQDPATYLEFKELVHMSQDQLQDYVDSHDKYSAGRWLMARGQIRELTRAERRAFIPLLQIDMHPEPSYVYNLTESLKEYPEVANAYNP